MKNDITAVRVLVRTGKFLASYPGILGMTLFFFLLSGQVKSQDHASCAIPSFPTLTIYQSLQTGQGMGFGVEAGKWNKDSGRFSYFFGTRMVWASDENQPLKTHVAKNQTFLTLYIKGQYKLTNHLYFVAAPGIVNLSYMELESGLRYAVPLSRVVGIGIEPAYAFKQQQFLLNINLHFALR